MFDENPIKYMPLLTGGPCNVFSSMANRISVRMNNYRLSKYLFSRMKVVKCFEESVDLKSAI